MKGREVCSHLNDKTDRLILFLGQYARTTPRFVDTCQNLSHGITTFTFMAIPILVGTGTLHQNLQLVAAARKGHFVISPVPNPPFCAPFGLGRKCQFFGAGWTRKIPLDREMGPSRTPIEYLRPLGHDKHVGSAAPGDDEPRLPSR